MCDTSNRNFDEYHFQMLIVNDKLIAKQGHSGSETEGMNIVIGKLKDIKKYYIRQKKL